MPPAIIAAVPPTGSSAADPGNAVAASNTDADRSTAPAPAQVKTRNIAIGSRRILEAPNARNAPARNSHALIGDA